MDTMELSSYTSKIARMEYNKQVYACILLLKMHGRKMSKEQRAIIKKRMKVAEFMNEVEKVRECED